MIDMAARFKVYTWMGSRPGECPPCANGSTQTYEVVAAKSKAAAARLAGESDHRRLFNFAEGGSPLAETVALADPEVVFWRPFDDYDSDWRQ